MILAVVVDAEGRPICTEMMPGNTADVSVLVPVIDRLRHRFGIARACIVADRGMIAEATIAALDERGLEYVLGVRERTDARVRTVLDDARPFTPLLIERSRGETQLFVKEVQVEGIRYIAARNEAEAEKDAADRQAIVAALDEPLANQYFATLADLEHVVTERCRVLHRDQLKPGTNFHWWPKPDIQA